MELLASVKEWVRNIAVIIVVAGFLELILPQSDLQRFARLVVGFFILLAIIQPLVGAFRQQVTFNTAFLEAAAAGTPDTAAVLAKGQELQANHTRVALAEYRAALERQVIAMSAWLGAEVRTVSVDLVEDQTSRQFGAIRTMRVTVGSRTAPETTSTVIPVAPVRIEFGSSSGGSTTAEALAPVVDERLCATIARTLAGYYGLAPEAVTVTAGQ
ncbi:MAG: stage III sporulation protein AF [Bacillota bacterium]